MRAALLISGIIIADAIGAYTGYKMEPMVSKFLSVALMCCIAADVTELFK